jgi:cytidylate kinase
MEGPRPPHDSQARRGPLDGAEKFRGQVTLDGPSGTGKSSVARAVATRLGAAYLDTGAMYRAATVAVLDAGVDLDDPEGIARAVAAADIRVGTAADAELVQVDGVDVAQRIRGAEVTRTVSPVSAVPAVRRMLVDRQRALVAGSDAVVVEGRDIGTVVLPDATLKIYLTAAPETRAERRAGQLGVTDAGRIAEIAADLRRRDEYDSRRADSPLRPAADAVVVEGRDIGTVVLPDATLKIYLTAAPEARAERRAGQLGVTDPGRIAEIAADLRRRDEYDSSRADSPLRPAADAVVVDSTGLDREAVVERVLALARTAVGEPA